MPESQRRPGDRRRPLELYGAMWRQVTPRNLARVLPAWLGFVVGFVVAATGDTRGSTVQTVIGVAISVPCFLVFVIQVGRILLPMMRR